MLRWLSPVQRNAVMSTSPIVHICLYYVKVDEAIEKRNLENGGWNDREEWSLKLREEI